MQANTALGVRADKDMDTGPDGRTLVEAKLALDDSPAHPLRRRAAAVLADAPPGLDYRARTCRRRR